MARRSATQVRTWSFGTHGKRPHIVGELSSEPAKHIYRSIDRRDVRLGIRNGENDSSPRRLMWCFLTTGGNSSRLRPTSIGRTELLSVQKNKGYWHGSKTRRRDNHLCTRTPRPTSLSNLGNHCMGAGQYIPRKLSTPRRATRRNGRILGIIATIILILSVTVGVLVGIAGGLSAN